MNPSQESSGAKLTRILIAPANRSIPKGTNLQFTATGVYSDGSQHILTSVTWQTSAAAVVTINAQGQIAAITEGIAEVTATSQGVVGGTTVRVGVPNLVGIAVSPAQSSLPLGESEPLAATGTYSDGTTQNISQSVTWSSSAATASVNATGTVVAKAVGSATITATSGSLSAAASLTVGPAVLVGIAVSPNQSALPLGESEALAATGNYSDGTTQNLTQSVTWSASASIVSVNPSGLVAAKAVGSAAITAISGNVAGTANVTVASAALVSIAVNPSQASVPLGESVSLTATGTYSDGSTQNLTQSATWSSSSAIAAVSSAGAVVGKGMGKATITAAQGSVSGTSSLAVAAAVLQSIAVSPSQSSLPLGESESLTATGNYSDGSKQNLTQAVTWSSSAASASVTATGAVTANAVGSAVISATQGSVSGSANLSLTPAVAVSLTATPSPLSLVLGGSQQLLAIATFSDGTTQDMTSTATWSSSQPTIATVSTAGMTTALQVGSTTILAQSSNLTGSVSLTVLPLLLVNYFNRANAVLTGIDGTMQLANPGVASGDLCAMVYVFDSSQEMNECCGCLISDSGLLTLSLVNDLTANTLTGKKPVAGVIEVIPSAPGSSGQCNAASPVPNGVLSGWETNIQTPTTGPQMTEAPYIPAPLTSTETQVLSTECSMIQQLGSGQGICTCGTGN